MHAQISGLLWPLLMFFSCSLTILQIYRVGDNHIYLVYIRYFWQGNRQIYGHIRCIFTIQANPAFYDFGQA